MSELVTKDEESTVMLQEDCIPLLEELEPSPVPVSNDDSDEEISRSTTLPPLGLSGGGRNLVKYLTRMQKYSSITFTVFIGLHLTNTSVIPLLTQSIPSSDVYLLLSRPYYQSFPLELILVVLPIALHVTAGLGLRIHQRNVNLQRYGASLLPIKTRLKKKLKIWPHISWISISGYLLVPLILQHTLVNRILPLVYEGGNSGVGLGYVAHSFARHPILAAASYTMIISVAAGHFCWGIARWAGLTSPRVKHSNELQWQKWRRRRWWVINGAASTLMIIWMTGGLGIVARGGKSDGWIGRGYDILLQHIWL